MTFYSFACHVIAEQVSAPTGGRMPVGAEKIIWNDFSRKP